MCGITGIVGLATDERTVMRMADALAHRGPDDAGVELFGGAGDPAAAFAHRRLAILDLSPAGHQPMWSRDRRWCIAFNGEIYNFRTLREGLVAEGVQLRSGSDTEVLLEGFAKHGPAYLERLRGMYAFALWDAEAREVYLARDPFGIKPLYVAQRGGSLLFASELRALLASGVVERAVSGDAVRGYLEWGSVPEPLTMIAGVTPLPPGSCVRVPIVGRRAMDPVPVGFVPPVASDRLVERVDRAAAPRLVRDALRDAVAHHLVSDVPVALFLSGGIDSSAVVALASEVAQQPLATFTVTFSEKEFSEAPHAARVAKRFGTEHHEVPITGDDLFAAVPHAFAAMDQPSIDGLNTYVVSRAVRDAGLKVVLSGLGGDELFAGYPSFRRARAIAPFWRGTGPLRRAGAGIASLGGPRGEKLAMLLGSGDPAFAAYTASRTLFTGSLLDALHGSDGAGSGRPAFADAPAGLSLLQGVSWLELTGYMRDTLLRDSDVFSMAHALELRVPFVDRGVAAAAMALPDGVKLRSGRSKPVIVDALGDLLPREVWDRPKQGFTLPFEHWMRGALRRDVADVLSSPRRLERVGVRPAAARAVWDGFLARRAGMSWSRPWALYTLVRWAEQVDAHAATPLVPEPAPLALTEAS